MSSRWGRCNLSELNRYLTIWHCFTSLTPFIFEMWDNKLPTVLNEDRDVLRQEVVWVLAQKCANAGDQWCSLLVF